MSDKFLFASAPAPAKPKTYAERRKEAQRLAAIKNEQNRKKSKRQLEQEAREEGLSKSLFERAKDEEAAGQQNKALAMMMKMGYKPGESLGQKYDSPPVAGGSDVQKSPAEDEDAPVDNRTTPEPRRGGIGHITVPLPLNEWIGTSPLLLSPSSPLVLVVARKPVHMLMNRQERQVSACANGQRHPAQQRGWRRWPSLRRRPTIPATETAHGRSMRSGVPRDASHLPNAPAPTSTRRMAVRYVIPPGLSCPHGYLTKRPVQHPLAQPGERGDVPRGPHRGLGRPRPRREPCSPKGR